MTNPTTPTPAIEAGISDARLAEICRALRYTALNAKHYFGGEVPLKPLTDAADLIHALRIQNALLKAELDAYAEAALYDALMSGPVFKGWNQSQLNRARKMTEERINARD